ncbi:MAG TPA: ATP-dependent DNA ligase, partial [Candidatus Acidoferrales bacterium]|nr:ATP-dependent DNA ligase [Candidatus Acidoferrales bacterium]
RDQHALSVGGRGVVAAARLVWGFDDDALSAAYRATGDLGSALGTLVRPPRAATLFPESLTPASLSRRFHEIAALHGKSAGKRREAILERIFRACDDPLAAAFVVKIVTGDLRIGLREGLVFDAIASAFDAPPATIRRAAMASGDAGEVAVAAKRGTLDSIEITYGSPIGFMLASPIPYGDAYPALDGASWLVEEKFDGIRAQAHVRDGTVRLFSRTLNDVTGSYPDVAAALAGISGRAILDGEIVAMRDGRVLPFRALQARLQRKNVGDEMVRDVPLVFVAFDAVARGDDLLVERPQTQRREVLESIVAGVTGVVLASSEPLPANDPAHVNAAFEAARANGNEGAMLKRTDAPYAPGRRGKWWLKLKRELSTLDVVVVAVEWGHGKRSKVLSDYTFAVRADDGGLVAIGKAFSGLTDAEIAELTPWFLEHRRSPNVQREKARGGEIPVEPAIVLEVAFDVIQESDLHESGFSLRFPRIVRVRDDKPATEIDTLQRVREIHAEMLEREAAGTPGSGVEPA